MEMENLKHTRLLNDNTQKYLEVKTGIPQSVISLFENGYRTPSDEQKVKLAEALGKKADQIDWDRNGRLGKN